MAKFVQERDRRAVRPRLLDLSAVDTLDSIEYFVFPNAFFFPGLQLSMIYRFRPDGPTSIGSSFFDLVMLRPRPRRRAHGAGAARRRGARHRRQLLAGRGPGALGRVYDQDTANMAAQTRGFNASPKRGQTLGNYQEIRARHLQATGAALHRRGSGHWRADRRRQRRCSPAAPGIRALRCRCVDPSHRSATRSLAVREAGPHPRSDGGWRCGDGRRAGRLGAVQPRCRRARVACCCSWGSASSRSCSSPR